MSASRGRAACPRWRGFEGIFLPLSLCQIQTLMARAEYLKDQMKVGLLTPGGGSGACWGRLENDLLPRQMREAQSMGKEALAEPVRSSESLFLSPLVPSERVWRKGPGEASHLVAAVLVVRNIPYTRRSRGDIPAWG